MKNFIASLTFKSLHFRQPLYLANLLHPYVPTRELKSMEKYLLVIPDVKLALGHRSFSFAAPTFGILCPFLFVLVLLSILFFLT